jgi:hypothetical protein
MAEPPKPEGAPAAAPTPKPRPQNPVFRAMGIFRQDSSLGFTTWLTCAQAYLTGASSSPLEIGSSSCPSLARLLQLLPMTDARRKLRSANGVT